MLEPDANNELNTQIQYRLIEKLTQSERRYRELVENLREIVFECDCHGSLTFLNHAWEETLGYSSRFSLGEPLDRFLNPLCLEQWHEALAELQDTKKVVLQFIHQNGQCLWLELAMRVSGHSERSGSLVDITERRQAAESLQKVNEQLEIRVKQRTSELSQANQNLMIALRQLKQTQSELIQTEKMSSLGQLVAGIAHEINNPVSFICGNLEPAQEYVHNLLYLLELYQTHYPNPEQTIQREVELLDLEFCKKDFPKLMNSMQIGTKRIQSIVTSLRSFSRLHESSIKKVDIHDGLEDAVLLLQSRLQGSSATFVTQVVKQYGDVPLVECFPGELNQVFMHVLTNAIDVLEEEHNSFVTVVANYHGLEKGLTPMSVARCSYSPTITIQTQRCGDHALISIRDNGPGIAKANLSKLFDPFFTTKPVGQGTGLGLAISHQIITERHGGDFQCHSIVGKGAEFIIRIPISLSHKSS